MKNVALILLGAEKLEGGGGAERFFADFFLIYQKYKERKFRLFFVTDEVTLASLKSLGRDLPLDNILILKTNSTRFKKVIENIRLVWLLKSHQIKILHFVLYTPYYYRFIELLNKHKSFIKTKISINIVNCEIPHAYFDKSNPFHQGYINTYKPLFEEQVIDGYFCWNKLFIDFIESNQLVKKNVPVKEAIVSRFSNTDLYYPAQKENLVVFAGRLDFRKRPDWFIEAVSILHERSPELFMDYKFLMFGKGSMRDELNEQIINKGISDHLKIETNSKLWTVLSRSKVFISCQDYDNFPSLAIAEAMAAGNAIIARNVGQTDLFVKHMKNGLLLAEDSPKGLATAIKDYIENESAHEGMAKESVRLMKEVHTTDNFIKQIDAYWTKLLEQKS